ncbi:hypothetical protein [Microcoleus sp. F4-D5]|uniref:hypothetical protein n=1 Tax=Microcoleus sp. F4-D5 TaxID=2818760 RepID=UPI002FD58B01
MPISQSLLEGRRTSAAAPQAHSFLVEQASCVFPQYFDEKTRFLRNSCGGGTAILPVSP